mgnify:CR=1 FL=1|tara:strand:- start:118 stop:408 length:291 start_codon:yes stop_codon:yes gene_type:complete
MSNVKVAQMLNNQGQAVKNQFYVFDHNNSVVMFQSYNSIIVKKYNNGNVELDKYHWDFSKTTGKYRNVFLGEKKPETERKIKQGIYKLVDLNKDII